ncbi:MAG: C-terminal binding protein [Spirochaetes bacterium]|nr:C-terminal binding protein [Spirochaetota bacterium]
MPQLVVVTDDRFGDYSIERSILEPAGAELRVENCPDAAAVAVACREAVVVLANLAPVSALAIDAMERCKAICRYGTGLDNVDIAAAARRGIAVRNVSGYCDDEVAEHALALLLDAARSVSFRDREIRAGFRDSHAPAIRVRGTTLGVLGFGGTATAFVTKAIGLGFSEILAWSPSLDTDRLARQLGPAIAAAAAALGTVIRAATLDELLAASDFVSLHLKLAPETLGFLGESRIAAMKRGAILVNVARGALVDENALADALESGRLDAAGLDVFATEPLPPGSRLRSCPNVVLTPHAAWYSPSSVAELKRRTALNALDYLR